MFKKILISVGLILLLSKYPMVNLLDFVVYVMLVFTIIFLVFVFPWRKFEEWEVKKDEI